MVFFENIRLVMMHYCENFKVHSMHFNGSAGKEKEIRQEHNSKQGSFLKVDWEALKTNNNCIF